MTKQTLDQLMKEYDWDINSINDTKCFLSFMFDLYDKLNKED